MAIPSYSENDGETGARPLFGAYARIGLPIFLFLITTVFLGSAMDPFGPVKSMILRVYAAGGFLWWLSGCLSHGELRWRRTPLDVPVVVLVLWCAVSMLYAVNRLAVVSNLIDLACGVFIFYMVVTEYRDAKAAGRLLLFAFAPVLVVAPLAVLDLLKISFFPWDYLITGGPCSVFGFFGVKGVPPAAWVHNFDGRVSASFGNPVYLAGFLVMLIAPAWVLFSSAGGIAKRTYLLIVLFFLEFTLIATFTRSAWICAGISLAVMWRLGRRSGAAPATARRDALLLLVILALLLGAFAVRGGINPSYYGVAERLGSIPDTRHGSNVQRMLIWKTAWEVVKANPVKGVGLGNYYIAHPEYQRKFFSSDRWLPHISYPDRAHNELLDIWAETGAVGLLLFLLITMIVYRAGRVAIRRGGSEARLTAALVAGGFGMLVYGLAQFPLHVTEVFVYGCVFAGLIVSLGGEAAGVREVGKRFRRAAGARERVLLGICAFLVLITIARMSAAPTLWNIAFFWGLINVKVRPIQALGMMVKGILLCPDDVEMSIRYGSAANALAEKRAPAERTALYGTVRDESLRGLSLYPTESRLYDNLGVAYIHLNMPGKAKEALERSIFFNPLNAPSFYDLGIAYYMLNNYNTAIYYYQRALRSDPTLPGVYQNLGLAYVRNGRYSDAATAYKKELDRSGAVKEVLNGLGIAYSRMGRRREAVSSYRKALEADPGFSDARGNLAIELIESGEYAAAAEELKTVIRADPRSGTAHYHLGRIYNLMGRKTEAVRELGIASGLMSDPATANSLLQSITGGAER